MPKKNEDLRSLTVKDLMKREDEIRKGLLKSQTQKSMGMVPENPGEIKKLKRTIARIKTIIKQKEEKE